MLLRGLVMRERERFVLPAGHLIYCIEKIQNSTYSDEENDTYLMKNEIE